MDSPDFAGRGDSMDKGDVCKRLLCDHRDVLVHLVPDHHQEKFQELLENLWIVLKIYCTKKIEDIKVDTPKLRVFCLDLYHLIFNNFGNEVTRWIKISPTVHSLLAHSWELIERNDCDGVGELSESGMEANNKFMRAIRTNKSRKISEEACLSDTLSNVGQIEPLHQLLPARRTPAFKGTQRECRSTRSQNKYLS